MREIVLDTETTGLDPASGHRLVEIGCVELMGRIPTGRSFHRYVDPERDMPEEAERVHGLSAEFLKGKPLFSDIAEDFLLFIGDAPLVIHNASFDMKFLNAELGKLGIEPLPMARAIDTVGMARTKFPGSPASLDALCKRFNIDLSARDKHGALVDAELLAGVYLELLGGRQAALELAAEEQAMMQAVIASEADRIVRRVFAPSAEELAAHAGFMAKIKEPIWAKYETPVAAE